MSEEMPDFVRLVAIVESMNESDGQFLKKKINQARREGGLAMLEICWQNVLCFEDGEQAFKKECLEAFEKEDSK